jgi:transglutaminase-like putative cysteine protease
MLIRIGYDLSFDFPSPTPMVLNLYVHPDRAGNLVEAERLIVEPEIPVHDFVDVFGNRAARIVAPAGTLRLRSESLIRDDGLTDAQDPKAQQQPIHELPPDVMQFLMGSRYCEVEWLGSIAWELFGSASPGWGRAKEVCNWIQANVKFGYRFARSTKTAWETYIERTGVCRDLTHLAVTFCRCLNIPARYINGHLGDIGVPVVDPMDFSAWIEVYLEGSWWTFDPRNNIPRIGRIVVARGRDAADIPLINSFGPHMLKSFRVWTYEVTEQQMTAPNV